MRHQIAIFSLKHDIHAYVVQDVLRKRGATCHVVLTNDLIARGGLSWTDTGTARVRNHEGEWFEVGNLDAIWWRRAYQPQLEHRHVPEGELLRLATSEWRGALLGALIAEFEGGWVNDPHAGRRAELKIVQLQAAKAVGLDVPPTYVGQDPARLRQWCLENDLDRMVIKKVQGTMERALLTVPLTRKELEDDASIRLCPAIYQAEVPGKRHLRVHVLGEEVVAAELQSEALDWRPDLNVPMRSHQLERSHRDRMIALNRRLGLEMSIMDAKLLDSGDLVWLEANPQGAFLFSEALAEIDVTAALADLLLRVCETRGVAAAA